MKNIKSKTKVIKELAGHFDKELQTHLPITVLPNGVIVYKEYAIKKMPNSNWGIFNLHNKDLVDQYFLKSCALMAAKALSTTNIEKANSIKLLDNRYWANYTDSLVFKHNLKLAKDLDKYLILLNRMEHCNDQVDYYKGEISRMFRWSFV
jgi:hypothetical protein